MDIKEYLFRNKSIKILLLMLLFLITSCASKKINSSQVGPEKPFVLTTFTILADMASNVAGDRFAIKSITKPGSEIHGYQFTPSDLVKAKGAVLLIENGLGLESWIDKFSSSVGNIPKVVLSEGMEPILIEGDSYQGKPNPHVWMSPKRSIYYVDKLLEAFSKIDPDGVEVFESNANAYKEELVELDKELRSYLSLIPPEKKILVSCEGAFSYLAQDYGMEEAYLWPVNAETQVTPRRMAALIEKIKEKAIPTIFCETTVSSKAQKEVAKESGAIFGGNFFVDSLSMPDGPASTLLDLQRYNVRLIMKGLAAELNPE
tara:strand:+ start:16384 stop:17334 length:951 start_codon:yes stop_codon:yes gene_type:complete